MSLEQLFHIEIGASHGEYVEKGPAFGPVFEFYVADLEAAKTKLLAAGCRIEQEDPSVPRCYVRDPYGLIFNLAEKKT
jgi:catechol 2,3-dioxygenase-like lactoylglutathione lyase family enzyme